MENKWKGVFSLVAEMKNRDRSFKFALKVTSLIYVILLTILLAAHLGVSSADVTGAIKTLLKGVL